MREKLQKYKISLLLNLQVFQKKLDWDVICWQESKLFLNVEHFYGFDFQEENQARHEEYMEEMQNSWQERLRNQVDEIRHDCECEMEEMRE